MNLFFNYRLLFLFLLASFLSHILLAGIIVLKMTPGENGGKIYCYLYHEKRKKSFPTKPEEANKIVVASVAQRKIKHPQKVIKGREMECRFKNIKEGLYAISGFHDNNKANRKLDMNWFGFPTEGYLASRDAKITLRAPRFEEAQFLVETKKTKKLKVKIRY